MTTARSDRPEETDRSDARPGGAAAGKPAGRVAVLAVISLAQLMITLDSTIVSVALPSVQDAVGLSDTGRQWVVTAYTLAFGGLLLLGGRLGDLMGRRTAMLVGVAGFAAASALGGAAGNPAMLIGARAAQGVFAAFIAPATLSLISTTFVEARERATAFGVYTATAMSGGAVGLILGGALTDWLGWRACLYVNIPIAAVVLIGGLRTIPPAPRRTTDLDLLGAVLGTGGIAALIHALGEAETRGWGSAPIMAALAVSALLLTAFAAAQSRAANPLVPLRVLTDRDTAVSFAALMVSAFCTYGMLLGMTYQLQTVMRYSPLETGLAFLAYVVTAVVFSTQVAGRLMQLLRPRTTIATGLGLFCAGLLLLTRLDPHATYAADVLPALLLFGVGVGILTVPVMNTVMSAHRSGDAAVVSALVNASQQIGGSIGAALLNTIAVSAAASYYAAHPGGPEARTAADVHGFAVASAWSTAPALVTALLALALIRADFRPTARKTPA
ncbi:MAG TPA: MFS transporter [Yinghuangia sp.]|nr:MFS transporter [Yinghuangia sp.]